MRGIGIVLGALMTLAFSTTATLAEMPKDLKGSWVLAAEATEHNIMASPKISPEAMKYLPTIMKRMSQYVWEFDDNVISSSRGAKKETLTVVLKENDKKKYVFEGQLRDQIIMLTVTFVSDTTINIRSSATDDMNYYLWKRGQLDRNTTEDNDRSLAIEIMEKSLNNSTDRPDAGEGE